MGLTARARLSRLTGARLGAEGGFTLIELIISMAILLIIIASLSSVLVSATRTEVDTNNRFQAQEQARTSFNQLAREMHCASTVTVKDSAGSTMAAGAAGSQIAATVPSTCATSGGQTVFVTWCTGASTLETGDFALYRAASTASQPTCSSAGKIKSADYLQSSTPFCLPSTTVACAGGVVKPASSFLLLHVTMPVNLNGPLSTHGTYSVVDDIALRNGTHA
jgi:prepilin-type N-terminal cleavage/methylation domain-containing protein